MVGSTVSLEALSEIVLLTPHSCWRWVRLVVGDLRCPIDLCASSTLWHFRKCRSSQSEISLPHCSRLALFNVVSSMRYDSLVVPWLRARYAFSSLPVGHFCPPLHTCTTHLTCVILSVSFRWFTRSMPSASLRVRHSLHCDYMKHSVSLRIA